MPNFLGTNQFQTVLLELLVAYLLVPRFLVEYLLVVEFRPFLVANLLVVEFQQFRVVAVVLLLLPDLQLSAFLNLNSPLRYHVQTLSTSYLA